jgi:hypothetical protein
MAISTRQTSNLAASSLNLSRHRVVTARGLQHKTFSSYIRRYSMLLMLQRLKVLPRTQQRRSPLVWTSAIKPTFTLSTSISNLCRAIITIIENPEQRKSHFEQQLVRLVRTEWTAGLSQPISFQGLETQKVINENEVLVLLPEAVRFIMDLEEREQALQVSRLFLYVSPLL